MDTPVSDQEEAERKDSEENKDLAAFSYVWVMSVIVFLLKRDSPFVRFHAKQAMILFALSILVALIPLTILSRFLELCILAGMVLGFLAAAQGQRRDVPFIGPLSRGEVSLRETWRRFVQMSARFGRVLPDLFKRFRPSGPHAPPEEV